jgi:hypothetical protein
MILIKLITLLRKTSSLLVLLRNIKNALLTLIKKYLCSYFVLIAIYIKCCIVYCIGNLLHIVVINKKYNRGTKKDKMQDLILFKIEIISTFLFTHCATSTIVKLQSKEL